MHACDRNSIAYTVHHVWRLSLVLFHRFLRATEEKNLSCARGLGQTWVRHHVPCGIMGPKLAYTAVSSWLLQQRKEDRRTGPVVKKKPTSIDLQAVLVQKKPAAAAASVATLESWHRIGLLRTQ